MSHSYFKTLNYTFGNEDSSMEMDILSKSKGRVVSIAGCGSRLLPFLAKSPKTLICADIVSEQLFLTELRIETVRTLDLDSYLGFWGYPERSMEPRERERILNTISISSEAKVYLTQLFQSTNFNPVLYLGRWEKTFKKISELVQLVAGSAALKILEQPTLQAQQDYYRSKFPNLRWNLAVFLMGNASFFKKLLYGDKFPKKNIAENAFQYYRRRFDYLFTNSLAKDNFFLQIVINGELTSLSAAPIECDPKVYQKIKEALKTCEIKYLCGNVLDIIEQEGKKEKIDFVSLSDVPSYFMPPESQNFLANIKNSLNENALVLVRYYLHVCENVNETGYKNITSNYTELINKEKTQMYQVQVYQFNESREK